MTFFFITALCMMVIATLLLLIPLRKKNSLHDKRSGQDLEENLAILRSQLNQFQIDQSEGRISSEQLKEAQSEIEKRLLQEETAITADQINVKTDLSGGLKLPTLIIAIGLPIFTFVLYLLVGSPQAIEMAEKPVQQTISQKEIESMVERLAEKLKADPNNVEGWQMLARSYANLQRMPEALQAYAKAMALAPNNAQIMIDYADLMAFQNKSTKGEPMKLIQKALRLDPTNLKVLALAGTAYYEIGDFKAAADYWKKGRSLVPAESEFAKAMDENIAEAQKQIK
jgi:cytochrome c-type biogenesis protein CcmH